MFLCIAVLSLRLLSKIIMIYNLNCYFFMQIKHYFCFILFKIDVRKLNYVIDRFGTKRLLTIFPHIKIDKISLIFVFPNHNFSFYITNQKRKIITEKYCDICDI